MFLRHASAGGSSPGHGLVGCTVVVPITTSPISVYDECNQETRVSMLFKNTTYISIYIYFSEERVQVRGVQMRPQVNIWCVVCVPLSSVLIYIYGLFSRRSSCQQRVMPLFAVKAKQPSLVRSMRYRGTCNRWCKSETKT